MNQPKAHWVARLKQPIYIRLLVVVAMFCIYRNTVIHQMEQGFGRLEILTEDLMNGDVKVVQKAPIVVVQNCGPNFMQNLDTHV